MLETYLLGVLLLRETSAKKPTQAPKNTCGVCPNHSPGCTFHKKLISGLCQPGGYQFRQVQCVRSLKDTRGSCFLHPVLSGTGLLLSPEQHAGLSFGQELSSNANSKDLLRVSQLPKPFTYIALIEPHASFSADPAHTPDLAEWNGKHSLDLS